MASDPFAAVAEMQSRIQSQYGGSGLRRAAEQARLGGARQQFLAARQQQASIPSSSVQSVGVGGGAPAGPWNGKLGSAPTHYGYAGMQDPAKQWVLRTLGQFPTLRFSSGLRSAATNAKYGGHPNSGHLRGWKADFSGSNADMRAAAEWLKNLGARTLLHDAGSGYHLDVSYEGLKL